MTTRVKKIVASFVAVMFSLSLAACSSDTATESKTFVMGNEFVQIEMTLEAKEDKVQTITQHSTIDTAKVTDTAMLDTVREQVEITKEKMSDITGAEYKFTEKDGIMTEDMVLPVHTKELLDQITEKELLPVTGENVEFLSLEQSVKSLTAQGWVEK
ncbi:MAG: DUF1307 domain-containing protein [Arcanobacterium sp.]|nr:DUF1307 domain-containing protein [Arcanobacterium sp.]